MINKFNKLGFEYVLPNFSFSHDGKCTCMIDAFVEAYYTISRLVLIIKSCKLNTGIILRFWTQILSPLKLLG